MNKKHLILFSLLLLCTDAFSACRLYESLGFGRHLRVSNIFKEPYMTTGDGEALLGKEVSIKIVNDDPMRFNPDYYNPPSLLESIWAHGMSPPPKVKRKIYLVDKDGKNSTYAAFEAADARPYTGVIVFVSSSRVILRKDQRTYIDLDIKGTSNGSRGTPSFTIHTQILKDGDKLLMRETDKPQHDREWIESNLTFLRSLDRSYINPIPSRETP